MISLIKIFKFIKKGTTCYSPLYGKITFQEIRHLNFEDETSPKILYFKTEPGNVVLFTEYGKPMIYHPDGSMIFETQFGECMVLPSEKERDWNSFLEEIVKNIKK